MKTSRIIIATLAAAELFGVAAVGFGDAKLPGEVPAVHQSTEELPESVHIETKGLPYERRSVKRRKIKSA